MSAGDVHREVVEKYADVLAGDLDALRLIDPEVIDHRGGASGDHVGIAAWRAKWESFAAGSPDMHGVGVTIEQNVTAGEYSVNRYTSRGTHTASGRSYAVTSMDMVRVVNGRIVEHWAVLDQAAMRHQLGQLGAENTSRTDATR